MLEAEIIDGLVMCPVCGYFQEAEPGEVICENSEEDDHVFHAVEK